MHLLRVWVPAAGLEDAELLLEWAAYDARGALLDTGRSVLAELPAAGRTDLVLAFERVLLTTVTLPKQNRRQLQRVAPFALEDRLLTAPEHSHCALGVPSGLVWPVAVVERSWLSGVLAAVRALRPVHAVWPGWYWLPVGARLWLGSEGWSRPHAHQGEYLLEQPAVDDGDPLATADDYTWETLAWQRRSPDGQAINLLQGSLAGQPRVAGKGSPWRWTAALAAAVVLLFYGQLGWSVWQGKQQVKRLNSGINATFYQVFPASASIVDPILQVERKLKEQGSGSGAPPPDDFLVMLDSTAGFIRSNGPVAGIDYSNGELQLRVPMTASAAEAMTQGARAAGMELQTLPPAKADEPVLIKLRRTGGAS